MKKDMERLVARARDAGADVSGGSERHWKVRCPNGVLIIVACSPSDHRAVKNARARLRRTGGLSL